ncbi:S5 DRBM domain-containing protein [Psidium guajava]|nr:S5 DRBM domain-containing protein [Psidium guajava]
MANHSALLCSCSKALVKAEKEYERVLSRRVKASEDEKKCALEAKHRARDNLNKTLTAIKANHVLVLNTVEEAKAFTGLLTEHFEDRGLLEQVQLGQASDDTKRKMWAILEAAGLELEQEELTFVFET